MRLRRRNACDSGSGNNHCDTQLRKPRLTGSFSRRPRPKPRNLRNLDPKVLRDPWDYGDRGLSPTRWQHQQFSKEFRNPKSLKALQRNNIPSPHLPMYPSTLFYWDHIFTRIPYSSPKHNSPTPIPVTSAVARHCCEYSETAPLARMSSKTAFID